MKFEVTANEPEQISADGILVFAFQNKNEIVPTAGFLQVDKILKGLVLEAVKFEEFKAKEGELLSINTHRKMLAPKVFVLGLGKREDFNSNILRKAIALFAKNVRKKTTSVALSLLRSNEVNLDAAAESQIIAEGFLLGSYRFSKYKSKQDNGKNLEAVIISEINKNTQLKIKEGIEWGEVYSSATIIARDLVNESAAVVTPTFLAQMAQDIAKKNPEIKCTIYDKAEIEKMRMGAFLGVALGSDTPPKFIHLEYTPKGSFQKHKKLAIVGKGITFDSGGVSIKNWESMKTMKIDMAGAAAVLGVFSVISKIKPSLPVMGLIAATPNLISGSAFVPGDVLRAMNGKTIEVLSTDAEGRLTMADTFVYAFKKGATELVDLATLTGACEVALGTDIAGLFGNDSKLKEKIQKAAEKEGEKVWELPLVKDYKELNKSDVADISNIPVGRYGGAITAALFLEEFVDNKPWVHMDIAGPAFLDKEHDLGPKGATGFGARLLLNFLRDL